MLCNLDFSFFYRQISARHIITFVDVALKGINLINAIQIIFHYPDQVKNITSITGERKKRNLFATQSSL